MARLTTALLANAIIRHTSASGGNAMVLAKGDDTAGSIILVACEKGRLTGLFERVLDPAGAYQWATVGPQDVDEEAESQQYLARRRKNDPDLWLIELDIAGVARFIAGLDAFG
jgi:hypothetical protein